MGSYDEFIRETIAEQSREEVLRRVKKNIWVTFQKEGIHKYPDAPDEVDFLRYPHRHMFHFKVQIEVYNDDRDIAIDDQEFKDAFVTHAENIIDGIKGLEPDFFEKEKDLQNICDFLNKKILNMTQSGILKKIERDE